MIISLCSHLFDYGGDHRIEVDIGKSDFSSVSRRVSRTATLDGGALIVDNGYSVSDATYILSVPDLSAESRLALLATLQRHSLITLSCKTGCYLGVVEQVDESQGFKIRFLVKTQLT